LVQGSELGGKRAFYVLYNIQDGDHCIKVKIIINLRQINIFQHEMYVFNLKLAYKVHLNLRTLGKIRTMAK
jgi:hypothetical protein